MNMHNIHFVIYSVAFLYTIRGVKTTIPFEIASKRIKYQGINLTKGGAPGKSGLRASGEGVRITAPVPW